MKPESFTEEAIFSEFGGGVRAVTLEISFSNARENHALT